MKNKLAYGIFALFLLSLSGCGPEERPTITSAPTVESSAPVAFSRSVDPVTAGTVRGKIAFEGVVPEPKQLSVRGNPECALLHQGGAIASEELVVNGGALRNVFVYVKQGLEDYTFTPPSTPAVIENKACVYVPHVMGVMVGQSVDFVNKDSTLHNVHSYPTKQKAFNLGLPLVGMKQTKKFESPEIMVPLKCDVHPWMQGYIGVLGHPYFSVSDGSGSFELKDLPPGDYVIEAWHEKLGTQTQNISIGPSETKEVGFTYTSS